MALRSSRAQVVYIPTSNGTPAAPSTTSPRTEFLAPKNQRVRAASQVESDQQKLKRLKSQPAPVQQVWDDETLMAAMMRLLDKQLSPVVLPQSNGNSAAHSTGTPRQEFDGTPATPSTGAPRPEILTPKKLHACAASQLEESDQPKSGQIQVRHPKVQQAAIGRVLAKQLRRAQREKEEMRKHVKLEAQQEELEGRSRPSLVDTPKPNGTPFAPSSTGTPQPDLLDPNTLWVCAASQPESDQQKPKRPDLQQAAAGRMFAKPLRRVQCEKEEMRKHVKLEAQQEELEGSSRPPLVITPQPNGTPAAPSSTGTPKPDLLNANTLRLKGKGASKQESTATPAAPSTGTPRLDLLNADSPWRPRAASQPESESNGTPAALSTGVPRPDPLSANTPWVRAASQPESGQRRPKEEERRAQEVDTERLLERLLGKQLRRAERKEAKMRKHQEELKGLRAEMRSEAEMYERKLRRLRNQKAHFASLASSLKESLKRAKHAAKLLEESLELQKDMHQSCQAELTELRGEMYAMEWQAEEHENELARLRIERHCPAQETALDLTWEFKGNAGRWIPYTPENSGAITRFFLRGDRSCFIVHDGCKYQIVLQGQEMLQTNCLTGKRRAVRRTLRLPPHWLTCDDEIIHQMRLHAGWHAYIGGLGCVKSHSSVSVDTVLKPITQLDKLKEFSALLSDAVFHHSAWQGPTSSCDLLRGKFAVCEAYHVENFVLYQGYQSHCRHLHNKHLQSGVSGAMVQRVRPMLPQGLQDMAVSLAIADTGLNENLLLHGTSFSTAKQIALEGFDNRTARPNGMYGQGTYFAAQSCKSHQYTIRRESSGEPLHTVLLARVALGDPHYPQRCNNTIRRPPKRDNHEGSPLYDSIIAFPGPMEGHPHQQQSHIEFVIFDCLQAYPEYILRYKLAES